MTLDVELGTGTNVALWETIAVEQFCIVALKSTFTSAYVVPSLRYLDNAMSPLLGLVHQIPFVSNFHAKAVTATEFFFSKFTLQTTDINLSLKRQVSVVALSKRICRHATKPKSTIIQQKYSSQQEFKLEEYLYEGACDIPEQNNVSFIRLTSI